MLATNSEFFKKQHCKSTKNTFTSQWMATSPLYYIRVQLEASV